MYDYIVVGCGLAGIAFCEQLRTAQKSFIVFDDDSQRSSSVAAGLYNPVVLKRFTPAWMAKEQLDLAMPAYEKLEKLLKIKLNHQLPVFRKFNSIEEQNGWFVASDQPILNNFMNAEITKNQNEAVIAPLGFGEVLHSGRIDTKKLITAYRVFLKDSGSLIEESFPYPKLKVQDGNISLENRIAKNIVFTEGFGAKKNPYFDDLPLVGLKGEMLTIKAPALKLDFIIKSSVFLVPLGEDLYWVGATYEHHDKTQNISEGAKSQLLSKLKTVISCHFEVINQVAGVRPTTKDRRPLVGSHRAHKNIYVLNGMGTRGVMISPYVALQLFNHIEHNLELDAAIDIKRFKAFR